MSPRGAFNQLSLVQRLARLSPLALGAWAALAGCSDSTPVAGSAAVSTPPSVSVSAPSASSSGTQPTPAASSAPSALSPPAWTVPRTASSLPTEADWDAGKADAESSSEGRSTLCKLRIIREWAAIRCGSGIALITQQFDLGKSGTDYVVGTSSGVTTFIRLRPGAAGFARFTSEKDREAFFSYSWADAEPAPRYLLLSEKNRHREVLTRADTPASDAVPAIVTPLGTRPSLGDWSSATRLTGGASAPSDCALLVLNDWLRIDCVKPLSSDSFDQYTFNAIDGLGQKGKDHYAQTAGIISNELVVELRMAKGRQKAKIVTSPITGNHHVLTVDWPEAADRPQSVVLAGNRK
jgi:hypothetical protein